MIKLFYDERDHSAHAAQGSRILDWLAELGARPVSEAMASDEGFLFAGARSIDDYCRLVGRCAALRDRPEERDALLRLDHVLDAMSAAGVDVPTPRTWRIPLDAPLPADLTFPLFIRTATSSLKLGGRVSRVRNEAHLVTEMEEIRRVLGWDAVILARTWCDFARAGEGMYGPVPQEVRIWIVDGVPHAWSFHYVRVVPNPRGFPPRNADLQRLASLARSVGTAFRSRLVAADFARDRRGEWIFIEAGPGSCAGTAHEQVFKSVAAQLQGQDGVFGGDAVGGVLGA